MLPIQYRETESDLDSSEIKRIQKELSKEGLNWWVARALALRGVKDVDDAMGNYKLLHYRDLKGIESLSKQLANGIIRKEKFVVVADYDCDGATACTVAVAGLRSLGADIDFVVPNRFIHGYGLTPSVVEVVSTMNPKWIVTVDNGTASLAGIEAAQALGIGVLVTDHHLPGPVLPTPEGLVNPNQPGCVFESKNLAGVGVMYYVLAAVKDELEAQNALPSSVPSIAHWLDLVALGTVADVVKLDANNRWLVRKGLARIRAGKGCPGIKALFEVSGKDWSKAKAQDFGFALGPRINAAGRLDDMTYGIRCLLAETDEEAYEYAFKLDEFNRKRKAIEKGMKTSAWDTIDLEGQRGKFSRAVYNESFHEGVIGIVAGGIKEKEHTPVVVFAKAQEEGYIKGSGRSIPGLHLRDVLDLVHKRGDELFEKFGGHAMAAGMTLKEERFPRFAELFEEVVCELMGGKLSQKVIVVDEELPNVALQLTTAQNFADQIWGQGFDEPIFVGEFNLIHSELIGKESKDHVKMVVEREGVRWEALHFFNKELPTGSKVKLAYKISVNEFRRDVSVNLLVEDKQSID